MSTARVDTVVNQGTIAGNGLALIGAAGVKVVRGSIGTIENEGGIAGNVPLNRGSGIEVDNGVIDRIDNRGRIEGGDSGIKTTGWGGITRIVNASTGVIAGTGAESKVAIDLRSDGDATIDNAGTIDGKVILGEAPLIGPVLFASDPIRTLNLEDNSVVTGTVTGSATSVVNVNGRFNTRDTFSVGQFNIAVGARLAMGHDVAVHAGGTLKNDGTLFVPAGKSVTIDGDYVQGGNGVFQTGVNGTAGPTEYGRLNVTGDADLSAGGKIAVLVTSAETVKSGVLASVLQAGGTLTTGELTQSVEDNSALWDFKAIKNGNSIDLSAELAHVIPVPNPNPNPGPDPDPKPGKGTAAMIENTGIGLPALGAARVIDRFLAAGNAAGDMQTILDNLGALPTQQQVAQAVSQMVPVMTGEMSQISLDLMQGASRMVQARLEMVRGLSSGDELADANGWIKPFGSWARQGDRDGVTGYRSDTYGFVLGADRMVGRDTRLGAAFSYANTKVDGNAATSAKVDTYQVIFYGSHSLDERTEVNFQADAGMNRNSTTRHIRFAGLNRTASADYHGWNAHLGLGIGRQFDIGPRTVFTPSLRADYLYIHDKGYTESGADALNLKVEGKSTDALVLGLDGKIRHALTEATALTVSAGVGYDALASRSSITSAFVGGGAAFITRGADPRPWLVRGGLGLSSTYANGMELTVSYDVEARKSLTNQTAALKLNMPF